MIPVDTESERNGFRQGDEEPELRVYELADYEYVVPWPWMV